MRLLVTNAKTIQGAYYAKGTVAEFSDTTGGSYHRLFGWPYADEDGNESETPVYTPPEVIPALSDLTKRQLITEARERGVELPAKATKTEIREILEAR